MSWLLVLVGCCFLVETASFREGLSNRLVYLALGIAVVGFGVAGLLPLARTGFARLLRVGGILIILTLAVRVAPLIGLVV